MNLSKLSTINLISGKIGSAFLVLGVLSIVFSFFFGSQILAFTGLGLTFWGALFLLISPRSYVEGSLLVSTASPEYSTIDRIVTDLKFEEKSYYIPAYQKGVTIPEHLSGLKDTVVFISSEKNFVMPSIEDISQGKFLLAKNKGAIITPPGLGLLIQIEKRMKADLIMMSTIELCEVLPNVILENFSIAKDLTMYVEAEKIYLVISNSMYGNLYNSENKLRSAHFLGCPIVSAVACILAQTSGKIITLKETKISTDGLTTETQFEVVG
jgi:hypothetical protein